MLSTFAPTADSQWSPEDESSPICGTGRCSTNDKQCGTGRTQVTEHPLLSSPDLGSPNSDESVPDSSESSGQFLPQENEVSRSPALHPVRSDPLLFANNSNLQRSHLRLSAASRLESSRGSSRAVQREVSSLSSASSTSNDLSGDGSSSAARTSVKISVSVKGDGSGEGVKPEQRKTLTTAASRKSGEKNNKALTSSLGSADVAKLRSRTSASGLDVTGPTTVANNSSKTQPVVASGVVYSNKSNNRTSGGGSGGGGVTSGGGGVSSSVDSSEAESHNVRLTYKKGGEVVEVDNSLAENADRKTNSLDNLDNSLSDLSSTEETRAGSVESKSGTSTGEPVNSVTPGKIKGGKSGGRGKKKASSWYSIKRMEELNEELKELKKNGREEWKGKVKRDPNFTDYEKKVLTELVEKFKDKVENKRSDHITTKMKDEAWDEISRLFNLHSLTKVQRSSAKLKTLWKAMKHSTRKKLSDDKMNIYKTGGGPQVPSKIDSTDEKILSMFGSQFIPQSNAVDDDAMDSSHWLSGIESNVVCDAAAAPDEIQAVYTVEEIQMINMETPPLTVPLDSASTLYVQISDNLQDVDVFTQPTVKPRTPAAGSAGKSRVTSTITRPSSTMSLSSMNPLLSSPVSTPLFIDGSSTGITSPSSIDQPILSTSAISLLRMVKKPEENRSSIPSEIAGKMSAQPFFSKKTQKAQSSQNKKTNINTTHSSIQSMSESRSILIALEMEIVEEKRMQSNLIHEQTMTDLKDKRNTDVELHENKKELIKLQIEREKLEIRLLKSKLAKGTGKGLLDDDVTLRGKENINS